MRYEKFTSGGSVSTSASQPAHGKRRFRGVAYRWWAHVDDPNNSMILPGAFANGLREQGHRVRVLWDHDREKVIGRPVELFESARGLELVAEVDPTPLGDRVLTMIETGTISELSVGFDAVSTVTVEAWNLARDLPKYGVPEVVIAQRVSQGLPVRLVAEARLWEVSAVVWAAQRDARIEEQYRLARARGVRRDAKASVQERLLEMYREAVLAGIPLPPSDL
jgi:HK97 family phage prohead protease